MLSRIPQQFHAYLAQYFQSQIEAGSMRELDPQMLAQLFWGMFFPLSMSHSLFGTPAALDKQAENMVRNYVSVFLNGIHPIGD